MQVNITALTIFNKSFFRLTDESRENLETRKVELTQLIENRPKDFSLKHELLIINEILQDL